MEIQHTDTQVEWDPVNQQVVVFHYGDGSRTVTGAGAAPGTHVLRPLRIDYPDGYHPGLVRFLGQARFETDPYSLAIIQTFPDADVSPERVLQAIQFDLKEMARKLLSYTDWYYVAVIERGIDVPREVWDLRNKTRAAFDKDWTHLWESSPAAYSEFTPEHLNEAERLTLEFLGAPPGHHHG